MFKLSHLVPMSAGMRRALSSDIKEDGNGLGATITVSAETSNVRDLAIQLKDGNGVALSRVAFVLIAVFTTAGATAFATTGGSTGIAIGTNGALLAIVAKKLFGATSESNGRIDLTWTDTGTESVAVAVIEPGSGRVLATAAFANT